jgi:hypothetical protein
MKQASGALSTPAPIWPPSLPARPPSITGTPGRDHPADVDPGGAAAEAQVGDLEVGVLAEGRHLLWRY